MKIHPSPINGSLSRRNFIGWLGAAAVSPLAGRAFGADVPQDRYARLQKAIDDVTPQDYKAYQKDGPGAFTGERRFALERLDAALDKVMKEVRETVVTDKPAIWLVYNMGIVVKTKDACFTVDLRHRMTQKIAPLVDFALITHNHGDHYTGAYYQAIDGAGKVVISNFKSNAGVKDPKARGRVREPKTFNLKGVEIRATFTDHSRRQDMVDFTSPFEIRIGKFVIFHSGDCCNVRKLNPTRRPDLWIVHPRCGMKVADGVKRFKPVRTVIAHLNELGHPSGKNRWTWGDGFKAKAQAEAAGSAAIVPLWGDRIQ